MNANKQDAGGLPNELGFEQWYVTNTFDYPSNPLGSRDCSIARKAWHAALDAIRNGEQCRAASVASDDAIGVLEMIVDGRISGRISEWPQIKPAISEVLRALSRGAPEGDAPVERTHSYCASCFCMPVPLICCEDFMRTGQMASMTESSAAEKRAAIAARRKEG